MAKLPFMATVKILMKAVKKGGDRQDLHERIRLHSMAATKRVKVDGEENDLIERIATDKAFNLASDEIKEILNPGDYIGRADKQVSEFMQEHVNPVLKEYEKEIFMGNIDLKV
jgi:adenylosuccinate lyase